MLEKKNFKLFKSRVVRHAIINKAEGLGGPVNIKGANKDAKI